MQSLLLLNIATSICALFEDQKLATTTTTTVAYMIAHKWIKEFAFNFTW